MKQSTVARVCAIVIVGMGSGLWIGSASAYPKSNRPRNAYCTTDSPCGPRSCRSFWCNCCALGRGTWLCCSSLRCDQCVIRTSGPYPKARPVPGR